MNTANTHCETLNQSIEPPPLPEFKKCPFCAEQVLLDAIKCKHCGCSLAAPPPITPEQLQRQQALQSIPNGRFSCPRCHSQKTSCGRDINFAIVIIIFISLGLGLIMIPFLPYSCQCSSCGHKWKA